MVYARGFPPREYGGPVVAASHLVKEFLLSGQHVILIVQTDHTEEEIRHRFGMPDNLRVLRLRYYPSFQDLRALREVARALRQADIVYFTAFPFRHLVYLLLSKLVRVPAVFRLGGLLSSEAESTFGPAYPFTLLASRGRLRLRFPRTIVRALLAVYRWVAPRWTAVIVNSEALKRRAVKGENFDPLRLWVVPNGVDVPSPPLPLPVPHDGPTRLLYVGKLERIKGPDLLFGALEHLAQEGHPVELSIAGGGSLEPSLREWAGRLEPHGITFHGVCDGERLQELYRWSDVVVVPSRYESCPLVVLETMAAGRPLVGTRVGGIPELVRVPQNALLEEPDAASLARAITQLAEDYPARREMAEANLREVRRYTWSAIARQYVSIGEGLLQGGGPSP